MIAVTPEQFSASAIAWIGALTVVATAVTVALAKIAPMANQIKTLFKLHEASTEAIQKNNDKIVDVALAVAPPSKEVEIPKEPTP